MRLRIGFSFGVAKKRRAITHRMVMPFRWVASGVVASARWVGALPGRAWRKVVAGFRATLRSPASAYRSVKAGRDWLLAKIEYLNSESQKWKTLFNILKSPFSLLRAMGFSPQMAATFLIGTTAVTTGVVANEVLEGRSFARGDAGVYTAPLDAPVFYEENFNTLRLDLGSTSVGNITIEDITLGTAYTDSALPSGETKVVIVGGLPAVVDPAFTETYLEVGTLIVDRWRCATLTITNSEVHNLIIRSNTSDGQSISAVAGVPRDRGIGGGNRADDMLTSGGYYDQLKITAASSGVNGKVDVLQLSNLYNRGNCAIDRVKAGTMDISFNEIGGDEDLATKAFTVATSVIYKSFTNIENVEAEMALAAIQ